MDKWVTKIWLPLLLLALAIAVFFESSSVTTIKLDNVYSLPAASEPRVLPPQRTRPAESQAAATVKSRLAVDESYALLNELVADQLAGGYLKVGYFDKYWPATVVQITHENDGIVFVRRDGTRHSYTKFDGYRMRMVRLNDAKERETIVVFFRWRSADRPCSFRHLTLS